MEVTNLRILPARCFGLTENPFSAKYLDTQESKKMAYELILQQAFEVLPVITAYNLNSDAASKASFKDWVAHHLYQGKPVGYYTPQGELVAVDFLIFRQLGASPPPPSILLGVPYYNFIVYLNIIQRRLECRLQCQQIDQNSWYLSSLGVFTKLEYKCQVNQRQIIYSRKCVARDHEIQVIASAFMKKEMQNLLLTRMFTRDHIVP